jgi:methylmalonyl-CoA epimerase
LDRLHAQLPFKILGINHIGIAAKSPQDSSVFFESILGLQNLGSEHVKEQQTLTTMFASSHSLTGARLEILEDQSSDAQGPIAKFLEKKGGGIHHIALQVDHIDAAIQHMLSMGVKMIDKTARQGAHKTKLAFVHPSATGGILIEFVEET